MISAPGVVGVLVIAAGATLLGWALDLRRPVLAERVRLALSPGAPVGLDPWRGLLVRIRRTLDSGLDRVASREDLSRRLERAGWRTSVDAFRVCQTAAMAGGTVLAAAGWLLAAAPRIAFFPLAAIGATTGLLGCDRLLARAVAARARRLTAELPAVAELLAFAVSAGESAVSALRRVVVASNGELVTELAMVLGEVRTGSALPPALARLAERLDIPAIRRFVDGIVVAVDRGTPLAEVLRAQAADSRAHGQRQLIESAARREVFMLVPVVFLILPTVVVVALYPGLQSLNLTVP